jgi:hypothetical protein
MKKENAWKGKTMHWQRHGGESLLAASLKSYHRDLVPRAITRGSILRTERVRPWLNVFRRSHTPHSPSNLPVGGIASPAYLR